MQMSKAEYARKRIHNGSSVQIENSATRITDRHHSASLVMPNSYPRDGIFNQRLRTIKDSYNQTQVASLSGWFTLNIVIKFILIAEVRIPQKGLPAFTAWGM